MGGTGTEPNHLKGNAITRLEHMGNLVQRARSATFVFQEATSLNRPPQREPTVTKTKITAPEARKEKKKPSQLFDRYARAIVNTPSLKHAIKKEKL